MRSQSNQKASTITLWSSTAGSSKSNFSLFDHVHDSESSSDNDGDIESAAEVFACGLNTTNDSDGGTAPKAKKQCVRTQSCGNPERWSGPNHQRKGLASLLLRYEGILFCALAHFLYALIAFFFKLLNDQQEDQKLQPDQAVFVRMTITFSGCIAYLLATKDPHPFLGPPEVRHLLVLRALVGFFGVYGGYVALQRLMLTDVTVIGFLSPICTAIMGAIFLGERFMLREAVAACLSLAGIVLIVKPRFLFK